MVCIKDNWFDGLGLCYAWNWVMSDDLTIRIVKSFLLIRLHSTLDVGNRTYWCAKWNRRDAQSTSATSINVCSMLVLWIYYEALAGTGKTSSARSLDSFVWSVFLLRVFLFLLWNNWCASCSWFPFDRGRFGFQHVNVLHCLIWYVGDLTWTLWHIWK